MNKEISLLLPDSTSIIDTYCYKINKEYQKEIYRIIEMISIGENLDLIKLKEKYLKKREKKEELTLSENSDELILDKITFNDTIYYVDKVNNNTVYNTSSQIIGKYHNNVVILN